MGSKQAEEMGLSRKGDGYEADPKHFTILGVDIGRAELIRRYEGKPTEIALIEGIKQDRRQKALGDPSFVESCESGVTDAGQFIRLKPDNKGKAWLIIDKGNNRCFALRIVNEKRAVAGHPPFLLPMTQAARPGSGEAAGKFAREKHALSNKRAPMLPSHKAEIAAGFRGDGLAPHSIVRYLDGVTTEAEVLELLALDGCIDAVKDSVDAGHVPAKAAIKLAKMSEEKQAEWIADKLAPKAPRAKSDAARPMPPAKVAKLAKEIGKVPAWAPLAALLLGTVRPGDIHDPDLRAACLRAFGDGGAA